MLAPSRIVLAAIALLGCSNCASMTVPGDCTDFLASSSQRSDQYSYAREGKGHTPVEQLNCLALAGDRRAQLELGKRYELGLGVERDDERAAKLYETASADIPEHTAIYTPPVRLQGRGQTMLIENPNAGDGLAEAKYRFGGMLIEGRGIDRDRRRGEKLQREALEMGFPGETPPKDRLLR